MELFELTQKIALVKQRRSEKEAQFKKEIDQLNSEISELERLEKICCSGLNLSLIQLAETIIKCTGKPHTSVGGRIITDVAAIDIANDCKILRDGYFGNKIYAGLYQKCDCSYGYGPKHGSIVDSVELKSRMMRSPLTSEQKNAAIYYLKNYEKIFSQSIIK